MLDVNHFFLLLINTHLWGIVHSGGNIISFEFGEPLLEIREPKDVSHISNEKHLINKFAHRNVYPKGEFSLFIESCAWQVKTRNSDSDIDIALQELSGQILTNTTFENNRLTLYFYLGGMLILDHNPKLYDDETETLGTLFKAHPKTSVSFVHKQGLRMN